MPVRLKKKPKQDLLLETINRFQVEQSNQLFSSCNHFRTRSQSKKSIPSVTFPANIAHAATYNQYKYFIP